MRLPIGGSAVSSYLTALRGQDREVVVEHNCMGRHRRSLADPTDTISCRQRARS